MKKVTKSIRINAPVSQVYAHWNQYERLPLLIPGVEAVRLLNDQRSLWRVEIWTHTLEWEAEIYDRKVDRRIAWRSLRGHPHSGLVSFHPLGPNATGVKLEVEYPVQGMIEWIGSALGAVDVMVGRTLRCFGDYMEHTPPPGQEMRHREPADHPCLPVSRLPCRWTTFGKKSRSPA